MQSEHKSCESVRRLLDAYVSNELLTETNLDILEHLNRCAACSAALDSRVHAREALKQAVQGEIAPVELLENIRKALPRRSSHAARERWAVAAVILVSLFLGSIAVWYLQTGDNAEASDVERVLNMGLAVYEHCPTDAGMESLGWEYNGLVKVIGDEMPSNYGIAAAHRCVFDGRLFVQVVLEDKNARAAFVVTEKEGEQLSDGDRTTAVEASGVPVYTRTINNHQVAGFETERHLAFVVSQLTGNENLQLASSIAALYAPSTRSTQKEARNGH
jgi:hypothetical protein